MKNKTYVCNVCTSPCKLDLGPDYVGAAPDLCPIAQTTGSEWEEVPSEG